MIGPVDPEELTAVGAPVRAELPPDTRMGAVHLTVADLDRSIAYYETQIGLVVHGGEGAVVRRVVPARVGQERVATTERELFGVEHVAPAQEGVREMLAARLREQWRPRGSSEREMEMPNDADAPARRAA